MSREALLDLLRERIGLDPATLGERVIDDACAEARRRLGVADDLALHARVVGDGQAWTACVEAFTVPESWFFRAGEQFADLARHARALPARPYRVLCLPSAAGEEAWSAAISLLDAGLAPGEFEVLGIDVSPAAIAKAGAGLYRRSVFRGQTPPATWLHPAGEGGYRVDPLLRRCVRFRTGNALDPRLLADEAPFAAVFCRNLLIYLHADARRRVLLALLSRLRPDGLLFAGQAEVLSSFDQRLQPWPGGSPLTFVTATGSRAAGETPASRRESPAAPAPMPRPATAAAAAPPASRPPPPRPAPPPAAAVPDDADTAVAADPIAEAHRLADAGRVGEARAACLAQLSRRPDDVAALFLLGLLESAAGDIDAADRAFGQVLYLDRGHLDALEQRIALAERRGERGRAADLRARAGRLRNRATPGGAA